MVLKLIRISTVYPLQNYNWDEFRKYFLFHGCSSTITPLFQFRMLLLGESLSGEAILMQKKELIDLANSFIVSLFNTNLFNFDCKIVNFTYRRNVPVFK